MKIEAVTLTESLRVEVQLEHVLTYSVTKLSKIVTYSGLGHGAAFYQNLRSGGFFEIVSNFEVLGNQISYKIGSGNNMRYKITSGQSDIIQIGLGKMYMQTNRLGTTR